MSVPRILAEALNPNNDALADVVGDRTYRVYPVWRIRRAMGVPLIVLVLMSLVGVGSLPALAGVLLFTAGVLSEAEIRIAGRG